MVPSLRMGLLWKRDAKSSTSTAAPPLEIGKRRAAQLRDSELHRWIETLLFDIEREVNTYFSHPNDSQAMDHLAWALNHIALLQVFLEEAQGRADQDMAPRLARARVESGL